MLLASCQVGPVVSTSAAAGQGTFATAVEDTSTAVINIQQEACQDLQAFLDPSSLDFTCTVAVTSVASASLVVAFPCQGPFQVTSITHHNLDLL